MSFSLYCCHCGQKDLSIAGIIRLLKKRFVKSKLTPDRNRHLDELSRPRQGRVVEEQLSPEI